MSRKKVEPAAAADAAPAEEVETLEAAPEGELEPESEEGVEAIAVEPISDGELRSVQSCILRIVHDCHSTADRTAVAASALMILGKYV